MTATQTRPAAPQAAAQLSPALIFETLNRYQQTMALKGAIDLGLFTEIAAGATTSRTIAERCHASERGTRILCDFLTISGFLTKAGDNYSLTPDTAFFLDRKSPAYMGSVAEFMTNPKKMAYFRDVAAMVRKGGTLDGAGSMEPDGAVWVDFAKLMVPVVMWAAQGVASVVGEPGRKLKVLDIAAGHGMFGIAIAQRNAAAEVYALDLEPVLPVAVQNAANAQVSERFHLIAGSVFDTHLGSDYDLVLIPNFLHHFSAAQNIALLKRVRAAMKPGGRVATVDFVPNDDRVSPPIPASFAMMMLGYTESGDAYTFREFDAMFREAGFGACSIQGLPPTPESLILTER